MKFLIISVFDDSIHEGASFREVSNLTSKSLINYCERHNYDFLIESKDIDENRHISWSKLFLAKKYLKNYDWIWCIDSDVMIMNHTIRLEEIIDANYDILVAQKENLPDSLNTGSIMYRNTNWNKEFMEFWYANGTEFFYKDQLEQSSLIKIIKNSPDILKRNIKLVNNRLFNSYYHVWHEKENFQFGDFCLHDAGTSNAHRIQLFSELQDKVIMNKTIDYSNWSIKTPKFL